MFGIGTQELLLILFLVLIIFGAKKLPEIGSGLGRAIRNFRQASEEPDEIDVTPKKEKQNIGSENGEKVSSARSEEKESV